MPVSEHKGFRILTASLGLILVSGVLAWVESALDATFAGQAGTPSHTIIHFALNLVLLAAASTLGYSLFKRYQNRLVQPLEELARSLSESGSLPESSAHLACYIHRIIPGAWVVVYAAGSSPTQLEAQASCDPHGQVTLGAGLILPEHARQNGPADASDRLLNFKLVRQGRQLGGITIEFPQPTALSPWQLSMLQTGSPVAALAMESFYHRRLASDQIKEAETRRRGLAQDLHDTLAQNIGFLRLKLDQLTYLPLENANPQLSDELQRLHATAEEAYEQVRSMLDGLNPSLPEDLSEALFKQALSICQRGGVHLRTHQIGSPFPLPSDTLRHVLFIAREALNNVEKHAQAGQVQLQLLWLENELILKITDDGVGFDASQPALAGHYGLWIMNNRAHEVGGELKITPAEEGRGTEVTLWIPRRQPNPGQETDLHPANIDDQGEV